MSIKRNTVKKEQQCDGVVSGTNAKSATEQTGSITAMDYATLVGTERTCRPRKYKNVPTVVDSIRFASRRESRRYQELKLLERAGEIKNLELQVPFPININGRQVCKYVADFFYQEKRESINGAEVWAAVIEDSKGYKTPVYRLKKKLVHAIYGYTIRES